MIEAATMPAPGAAPAARRAALFLLLVLALILFLGLGTWQVYRRSWKLDLIARTDARVHAPPVAPPGPAEWPHIGKEQHEYLHVTLHGSYLPQRDTLVQASTELGPGWWVLTPLREADGSLVLVNRGFVPDAQREQYASPAPGEQTVSGLLRVTEPHGRWPRTNDPAAGRWFSRDVVAIAQARGLTPVGAVAPYFVDAEGPGLRATQWPAGGLTVVQFPNNHLSYLLTWYGMAALTLVALRIVWRNERRPADGDR